jgi:nucleoside-diphosphate-sugar epimerase
MEGRPVTIYGDGNQTRDFVHVKDVARAHVLAADDDESTGKVLNIGTGLETSINDLVNAIQEVTGRKAIIQNEPWPRGDIPREFGDISLAEKTIGYAPETDLIKGINQIMSDLKAGAA